MARNRTRAGAVLRSLLWIAGAGALTFAVLVGILVSMDWRDRLEKRLAVTFGRPVAIGAVSLVREWPPRVAIEEFAVAGEGQETVFSAGEISLTLTPWRLLRSGEFGRLTAYGVRLADGEGAFAWAAPLAVPARLLPFLHVNLQDVRIGEDRVVVDHADLPVAHGGLRPFNAELALAGEAFVAEGRIGMPGAGDEPIALQAILRGPIGELEFDGTGRTGPTALSGALSFRVTDPELAADHLGLPVFAVAGLQVSGTIERQDRRYVMPRMNVQLGAIRLVGRAGFLPENAGQPAQLELKLAGGPLAVSLPALDGALAGAPDLPFDVRAELTLEALQVGSVVFPRLDALVNAMSGEIAIERLAAEGLGGTVEAAGALRTEPDGARLDLLFDLRQTDAEAVLRLLGVEDDMVNGRLGAHVELSLAAADWRTALARATGRVGLFLDRGILSRSVLAAFAGNDGEKLPAEAELSCAIADFSVSGGTAHAELLRLVAPEGDIAGEGWVHLLSRELSFVLGNPAPAGPPFELARNLALRGSLSSPLATAADGAGPTLPAPDRLAALTAALLPQIRATLGEGSPCLVRPADENPAGRREDSE